MGYNDFYNQITKGGTHSASSPILACFALLAIAGFAMLGVEAAAPPPTSLCRAQPIFPRACMLLPMARSTSAASATVESGGRSLARRRRASGSSQARTAWLRLSASWRTISRIHSTCARTIFRGRHRNCRWRRDIAQVVRLQDWRAQGQHSDCRDRRPCAMISLWPARDRLRHRIPLPATSTPKPGAKEFEVWAHDPRWDVPGKPELDGIANLPDGRSSPTSSKATGISRRGQSRRQRGRDHQTANLAPAYHSDGLRRSAPTGL